MLEIFRNDGGAALNSAAKKLSTKKLILVGMLLALMIALEALGIGLIVLPWMAATILHIPVIIGTLAGGLGVGLVLGLAFGVQSLVSAIVKPVLLSPLFLNPMVSILPRILIPVITYLVYRLLSRLEAKHKNVRILATALCGSLANTVFVMGMIVLLYADNAAALLKIPAAEVAAWAGGIALFNGLPEAAICAFLTWAVVKAVSQTRYFKELRGNVNK